MKIKDFSQTNKFVMASDISEETVHELKERIALRTPVLPVVRRGVMHRVEKVYMILHYLLDHALIIAVNRQHNGITCPRVGYNFIGNLHPAAVARYHANSAVAAKLFLKRQLHTRKTNDIIQRVTADTGAAVVLDVKTGGVLACVSIPGYDINDYIENYSEVLNRRKPSQTYLSVKNPLSSFRIARLRYTCAFHRRISRRYQNPYTAGK